MVFILLFFFRHPIPVFPQDVEGLRTHGQARAAQARGVIYLAALEPNTAASTITSSRMTRYHQNSSGCLVDLLQILPDDANVVVITEGAVSCGAHGAFNSHQALLWGQARGHEALFLADVLSRFGEFLRYVLNFNERT